ncbi:MAG: glycosyltransferase family 2 protein [Methanobrevibacter sp.]|nr:glycosyltransferase family 2 protein [Methanobrevibacter sp.]
MDVKISVVLPVYNVANYLRKCLDSLVNQTFEDFEVICVNDGSTDLSLGILEGYALTDSRFKIISQENKGLSGARNTGIQHVRGEYVLFVDSDDWIEENALEELYKHVEGFDSDITMFKFRYFNEDTKEISESQNSKLEIIPDSLITSNFNYNDVLDILFKISHSPFNKLYKTSFLRELDAKFLYGSYYEDLEFFYKVFLKAEKVSVLPQYLYFYRIRDESISNIGDEGSFDIFNVLDYTKQTLIDSNIYRQVRNEWLMFIIVNLKFIYLRLDTQFKDQFLCEMKEKYNDFSLNEVVYSQNWHYEDRAFHESILLAENYKEFDLYYEKICYEILSKHYETLSDEYKKQIDILTDENNQLKEKLNEDSMKNKFIKIVKS